MIQQSILDRLGEIVGAQHVMVSAEDLVCYSYDGTFAEQLPDAVVSPASTKEVSAILELALAAGTVPIDGGLVLNLTRLNRILEIDQENMTATAQAGVVTADLAAAAEAVGLFYPPDIWLRQRKRLGCSILPTRPAYANLPSAAIWPATRADRAASSTASPQTMSWP